MDLVEGNLNLNSSQKKKGEKKMEKLWNFIKDEDGLETVEWGVMLFLIVAGLAAVVGAVGDQLIVLFNQVLGELGG
jgi:Flp pilus assembly pilin Flp